MSIAAPARLLGALLVGALTLVACSSDDENADDENGDDVSSASAPATAGGGAPSTSSAPTAAAGTTAAPSAATGVPAVTVPAGAASVEIIDFAYAPQVITVAPGQALVFTNADLDEHTVTSETSDVLVSDVIPPGGQFSVTLDEPGTYDYVCTIHEFMSGSVEVTA